MASEPMDSLPMTKNSGSENASPATVDDKPTGQSASNSSESKAASKKQAKKEAMKVEKLRRKQEEEAAASDAAASKEAEVDPLAGHYGYVPVEDLQSKAVSGRKWTEVGLLDDKLANESVLIRGVAQTIRAVGKKMAFLVVRQFTATVQCALTVSEELVSLQMVKYAASLSIL